MLQKSLMFYTHTPHKGDTSAVAEGIHGKISSTPLKKIQLN